MKKYLLLFLFLIPGYSFAQTGQATEIRSGPALPTTCDPSRGWLFWDNLTLTMNTCTGTNVWGTFGGGGSGTINAGPQYAIPFYVNAGTAQVIGPSNITTDATENNLIVPGTAAITGAATVGGSLTVTGAATVNGNGNAGNVAIKALSNTQFVSGFGNDSNDGLSRGTAKNSIMAAYDAVGVGGTIFICGNNANQVLATSTGQGIWIMGPSDPNFASPPTGWRQAKTVTFNGDCGNEGDQQGSSPTVFIGGVSSYASPVIWLSSMQGSTANLTFKNLSARYYSTSVRIGVDSNGNQTNTSGVYGANFINMVTKMCNGPCVGTEGPGWFIGGGDSSDLFFDHIVAQGNPQATPGADNQAAMLFKAGSGISGFIAKITNSVMLAGQIKYYEPQGGSVITVADTYSESLFAGGTFWAASSGVGSNTTYDISNVFTADGTACGAEFDNFAWHAGNISTKNTSVCSGNGAIQQGSIVEHNITNNTGGSDPLTQGITGVSYGRYYGHVSSSQRPFSQSMVRFTNLAPSTSSSWTISGAGGSISTGITAPDGTTGAARVAATTGNVTVTFYSQSLALAVGQYFVAGFYERFNSPDNYYRHSPADIYGINIVVSGTGNTDTCSKLWPPGMSTDGWFWVYMVCQVTAAPTSPATVQLVSTTPASAGNASTVDYYAPVLNNIASGTVSNDEAYEYANALLPYNSTCAVGTQCGITSPAGSNIVYKDQSAILGAHTYDFSGVTLMNLRVGAGLTTSANGDIGYDTTNKNWHIWANGVDNFVAIIPSASPPTNGDCASWSVLANVITLADVACGGGGSGAFSGITSGTNTTAAMICSTGCSLTVPTQAPLDSSGLAASTAYADAAVAAANPMTTIGDRIGGGASGAASRVVGGLTGQLDTATNGATGGFASPGVAGRTVAGTTDTILCDSATTLRDRGTLIKYTSSSAVAVTLPQAGSSGCGTNFVFAVLVTGTGLVTITPTTSTINGQATLALTQNINCTISSPDNTNYTSRCSSYIRPRNGLTVTQNADLSTFVDLTSPIASTAAPAYTGDCVATSATTVLTCLPLVSKDTSTPITVSTTASAAYYNNQNATVGTAVTYNLPTAAAGKQFCFTNSSNTTPAADTGVLTIATSASGQFIIFTDGTLSATGGNITSSGAAADAACMVGVDSTHWQLYVQRGAWTKH